MIQITLYTDSENEAKQIAESLLKANLVAYVSIDIKNNFYSLDKDGNLMTEEHAVLKAITRALLFQKVEDYIHLHFKKHIKIYAVPIAHANQDFSDNIRKKVPFVFKEE
jgi:uncharacterized protein involved in tolerance to divalent cations